MTFENCKYLKTEEQDTSDRLDLAAVCPERHAFGMERVSQNLDSVTSNEYLSEQAHHHWLSIMEKFTNLPPQYQSLVLEGFAPHMTGENYPCYDRLRSQFA